MSREERTLVIDIKCSLVKDTRSDESETDGTTKARRGGGPVPGIDDAAGPRY